MTWWSETTSMRWQPQLACVCVCVCVRRHVQVCVVMCPSPDGNCQGLAGQSVPCHWVPRLDMFYCNSQYTHTPTHTRDAWPLTPVHWCETEVKILLPTAWTQRKRGTTSDDTHTHTNTHSFHGEFCKFNFWNINQISLSHLSVFSVSNPSLWGL